MREMPGIAQKSSQGGDKTAGKKPKNRKTEKPKTPPIDRHRENIRGSRKKKKVEARNFEARFHIQKPAVFTLRLDIETYA